MSFKIVMGPGRRTYGDNPIATVATAARSLALLWLAALAVTPPAAHAVPMPQDAVRRILTMLEAAAEDYREGVKEGTVVRPLEVEEAKAFVEEAQQRLEPLNLDAPLVGEMRGLFSTLNAAIDSHAPAARVADLLAVLRERLATVTGVSALAYPPAAPSAARGQDLFQQNCVSCHGEHGDGAGPSAARLTPPPANFTDPAFMRGETPYDFFHVISLGKRNTAMPAWDGTLTPQDRWDLVAYLWTLAPGMPRLAEGQGIYLTQCASCHGASGDGHAAFTNVLIKPAPDLSLPSALAQRTDAELFAATAAGIQGSPMPAFEHTISAADQWKAVGFLRALSLGGSLPSGSATGGNVGPDGKRFAGLLRLLSREYALAWSGGQLTDEMEYDEAGALTEQVTRVADNFAQSLETSAPDAARQLRTDIASLAAAVHARAPAAVVATAADALAGGIESHTAAAPTNAAAARASNDGDTGLTESMRLVDAALAAYNRGDPAAAGVVADAYLEFEPLEKRLGATAPRLKTTVEDHFMQLRQHLRSPHNTAQLSATADLIRRDFAEVRVALQPHTSPSALFLESATIILREGFEMVLVIGALLAYVVKSGHTAMRRPIYAGTAVGVVASLATAAAMEQLLRLHPASSDMLEGITMLLAAVVLFWVSYWLISKAEADKWQRYIRGKVQSAVSSRRNVALAGAAFLAVYREGFETVLFYQALYASAVTQSVTITAGFVAGAIALAAVYVAFRRFQVQIPIQQFFFVTGILLYVMAAVFAGQGVHELQDAGFISVTSVSWVPAIPLLGIFPSFESLGTQALFVGLLLYATAVTLRRRREQATDTNWKETLAELKGVRASVDALRTEIEKVRDSESTAPLVGLGDRLAGVVVRFEQLTQQQQPALRDAPHATRRHGH